MLNLQSRQIVIVVQFLILITSLSLNAFAQNVSNLAINAQLLVSARQADLNQITRLIEEGASPNSRNRLGKTTLFISIEKNRSDIVKYMLKSGADVNLSTVDMVSPLMAASYAGNKEIVSLLLEKKPRLEDTDRLHKTALIYAAGMGHTEVAEMLIAAGAKIDASYIDALTPLMWAAGQGNEETVKSLLKLGADKSLKDDRGLTALEIAKQNNQDKIVQLLK